MSEACTASNNVNSHNNMAMFLATVDSGGGVGPPGNGDLGLMGPGGSNFSDQTGINTSQDFDSAIYYSLGSDSQLQSPTIFTKQTVISSSQQTTPQTPTSIPDIILTGPGADEQPIMRQDFAKELGCAISNMSGSFDSDFFGNDEALRAGLGPIDFDGLQILTEISDPTAEEAFQLERS